MRDSPPIRIAKWAREDPFAEFKAALAFAPDVLLLNARTETFDLAETDGLILAGGADIDPKFLRQPVPDPSLIGKTDPERDAWDFSALDAVNLIRFTF